MSGATKSLGIFLVTVTVLFTACSSPDEKPSAVVEGRITVADSIDNSGDYSGIEVAIIKKDSAQVPADTLFYQVTDSAGHFSGSAQFAEDRFYTLWIDRNQRRLGQQPIILADGDSVHIEAQLPELNQTISIKSEEHSALDQYRRISRNYQRIVRYIQAGALQGDSARTELRKWGNLYWELYNNQEGTIASQMAARDAVNIFSNIDGEEMMSRVRQIQDNQKLVSLAANYGKNYLAEQKGLNYSLQYLDTLQSITSDSMMSMMIQQERIKLLYDSARIDQAKKRLADFKQQFNNANSSQWAESIEYDLNYLSPGDTIPSFSFHNGGRLISRDSLLGTPYILEITLLSNQLYQDQYDRTFVIHNIYKNFGLEVVTIPLDESQITIDAFFEERDKAWPVAPADAFDRETLVEKFNIRLVPTWFLIDRNGEIVRKYIGREYQDVIKGIQTVIKTEEPAS